MKFHKKIFPNGVRYIAVPMSESPTATVMVLVEAGSKYETKKINGVSHFLEHFLFKGTTKRPKPADISRELDCLGAQYNAFTGQESTAYFAKARKDKADKIVEIISDMYLNPKLPADEISKERGVIIQEINMYEDEPMRHAQDLFLELLYGDQPAGWNIAGTKKSVAGLNREHLADYRKKHYVAEATTVVVSGSFDETKMEKSIGKIFGKMSEAKKPGKVSVTEAQKAPAILVKHKETDQTHLVIGARAFDTFSPQVPCLKLLGVILGGGMSSRLFQKLRDELGLCYYVSASSDLYTDHGVFTVSAGVATEKVSSAITAILEELRGLADSPPPASELRKAKDFLIGNFYLSLESSDELAQFVGLQEVLRKPLKTPEQIAEEIEKVTALEIQNLARQIFTPQNLNLALIGPFKDDKQFLPLLR